MEAMKVRGTHVEIDGRVTFVFPERIELGSHIYIGPGCYLNGRGGLKVGDHSIFAPEVAIMTAMHRFRDADMVPYDNVELLDPVNVERCVWIGLRAIVLPGVTIGEGSVVGAGAVVTKSCPPGSILGGNPARILGTRDMDAYRACVDGDQFYLKQKLLGGLSKIEKA
jgi:acetyltransferase-like isoleucine patch superfamily enzyme